MRLDEEKFGLWWREVLQVRLRAHAASRLLLHQLGLHLERASRHFADLVEDFAARVAWQLANDLIRQLSFNFDFVKVLITGSYCHL